MQAEKSLCNEGEIHRLIDDWANTLRAKDLDTLMSYYAPDVVFFDGIPPLQYTGTETYRKNWADYFTWFPGPFNFETRDLKIKAADDTAFAHCLVHMTGTNAEGKEDGAWLRMTVCYEKIDGKWLVTHEHWSLPMDMESGKALTNLQPE